MLITVLAVLLAHTDTGCFVRSFTKVTPIILHDEQAKQITIEVG